MLAVKPRLVLQRGDGNRTVKLTPQARIEPLDTVIPAIPLDAIDAFHQSPCGLMRICDASYVIAGRGRIVFGR